MSNQPATQTGIMLKTSFFPLAWILYFLKPWVSIDGTQPVQVNWGEVFWPAAPGPHRINVWFDYFFFKAVGKAEAMVEVPADGVVYAHYKAPFWLIFLNGKIIVQGAAPVGALPQGQQAAQPVGQAQAAAQPQAAAAPAGQAPTGEAQWDAQRNAYIQWDAAGQRWLQFDNATQQWQPIS